MNKKTYLGIIAIGIIILTMTLITVLNKDDIVEPANTEQRDNITEHIANLETSNIIEQVKDTVEQENYSAFVLGTDTIITLSNNLVTIGVSTKGAMPCYAQLNDYNDQQGDRVVLFYPSEIDINFKIDGKNKNIITNTLYFVPISSSSNSVTMRMKLDNDSYLDFQYILNDESYMLNLDITAVNMSNHFSTTQDKIHIDWIQNLRQQEKGFEFEQRYTTLTYKLTDRKKVKIFSVTKTTRSETINEPLDWIAFKNQFFSTIIIAAGNNFNSESKITSAPYTKGIGYMKKMMAKTSVPFDPTGVQATQLQFYFGPNDYKALSASNRFSVDNNKLHLNKVIDLGWPIVREFNRYIIMPLFNLLSKWNLNMGIVLLLLTVIVKVIVYPFTYKSYMSSAKMRALKPYIEEINAKYSKQEDAMKKQQESMALYSKYGVSPMGGCLPSLIQMPVWMALFFFVPNAIALRQQSFLWAKDLTGFDDIISWNTHIPLIGNHLSIFCLLFCASNIVNTIFSMKQQQQAPGQEQSMNMMKWMMYFMPVIFFFTFNNYSSGLNYYYFISALTSIMIMIYLRRTTDEKKLLSQLEANYQASRNNPAKKRQGGNLMARLEAMQKEQERLQQQKRNK
ncbi:MAG TPA: membrane protein insertase YidC [Bacteroidaceae bacterium]|nr:membrane protein insertase YidC [Bacteroidaceae bacterium]